MRNLIFINKGEEYFVMITGNFVKNELLQVNQTGYEILQFMQEGKGEEEIVQIYADRFPEETRIRNDISAFCQQLRTIIEENADDCSKEEPALQNIKNHTYSSILEHYVQNSYPYRVFLELTYNCNLKCPHCYIQEDITKGEKFIDKEKVFHLIDQIEESGVVELNITGGECTLHPDFIDIVYYAASKNMKVTVLTNGQMIAEKNLIDQLIECPLADVRVSIYGTEEYHDQFVGVPNAFKRSVQTLKLLQEKKGIGRATYIITNENICYLDELKKQFTDLGIPIAISPIIMPTTYGDTSPVKYRLGRVDLKRIVQENDMSLTGASCTAGISRFRITPDGDVNPCEMLRSVSLGNVYETSFQEVMEGEKRKKWLCDFKKILEEHSCNSCKLRPRCNMCPGLFLTENGAYEKTSPFLCAYASVREEISREQESKH